MSNQIQQLVSGLETVVNTNTVVGEAIKIDGATIVPLIEVSFGMAAGAFGNPEDGKGAGGMGAKMTPFALLVVQNGATRVINIKNQDAITRLVDLIPDAVDKITGSRIYAASVAKAEEVAEKIGIKIIRDNENSEAEASSEVSEENSK